RKSLATVAWSKAWRSAATRSFGTSGATANGHVISDGALTAASRRLSSSLLARVSAAGTPFISSSSGALLPMTIKGLAKGGDDSNHERAVLWMESQLQQAASTSLFYTARRILDVPS